MKYEYLDTNIEWLLNYPKHWKLDRLRDNIIINKTTLGASTDSDFKIRYIDISNVNMTGIINFENIRELPYGEAPSRAKRVVANNNTIISSVRTNLQAVAYIDFNTEKLIASTGFFVCEPKFNEILYPKYLYWFLLSDYSKDYFFSRSIGVSYPAIDDYKFGSIKLAIPPIKEQKSISEYLEYSCDNIDKTTRVKEKQITEIVKRNPKIHHYAVQKCTTL